MTNIGVKILGLGMHVPETVVTNDDLATFWIHPMNGLQQEQG